MSDTPMVYQSLISARSRRLRVTGLLLLAMAVTMALYGYFSLMPSLRVSAAHSKASATAAHVTAKSSGTVTIATPETTANAVERMSRQEKDAQAAKLVFAYAFWGVCLLLVISVMLVAWLDFREVSRNFDQQQTAIFADSLKNEIIQTD